MLFPDSGDETVFPLRQISMQFSAFTNGTSVDPMPYSPAAVTPHGPVVLLNSIWLLSLMLSIASTLLATSTQHWARRYIQLPQIPSVPSERARVRSFLFFGTFKYDI